MALKVNWYPKITLHFLAYNSLILALFDERFILLEISLKIYYFRCRNYISYDDIHFHTNKASQKFHLGLQKWLAKT
jgi:hypothetical protein